MQVLTHPRIWAIHGSVISARRLEYGSLNLCMYFLVTLCSHYTALSSRPMKFLFFVNFLLVDGTCGRLQHK